MASARKKQDEKNLKTLRELVSLPHNKHCFDCHQRGPTYVNVTIGSFVCTKCSGMLRGLTPPHRVKSISMATFSTEEVDLVKNRGNDYCQKVWLGLYEEAASPVKPLDDHGVHTLMLDKYERKRYYMDPSVALRNGYNNSSGTRSEAKPPHPEISRPAMEIKYNNVKRTTPKGTVSQNGLLTFPTNGTTNNNHNNYNGTTEFVADFAHADIFNAANNNNSSSGLLSNGTTTTTAMTSNFANFDNNPIFNNETPRKSEEFSIFDLQFTYCGPVYNQVPLFPRMNLNRWSTQPQKVAENNLMNGNLSNHHHHNQNHHHQQQQSPVVANSNKMQTTVVSNGPMAPSIDRYAALKDLDNEFKQTQTSTLDWSSAGSNSSLYSSPNTPGSIYSSTASPQSSSYGSPSQGQFMNLFPTTNEPPPAMNPFNHQVNGANALWTSFNGNPNPFRATPSPDYFSNFNNGTDKIQAACASPFINGTNWTPNPFKVANGHSSNPFL